MKRPLAIALVLLAAAALPCPRVAAQDVIIADFTPAGGTPETLSPTAIETQTNLTGAVTTVDEDPDSPGGDWMTATDGSSSTLLRVSFDTPADAPTTGAGLQEFKAWVRETGNGSGTPTLTVAVRETGGGTNLASTTCLIDTAGELCSLTWDASILGTSDGSAVEAYLDCPDNGGGPNQDSCEIDAIEWNKQ